MNVENSVNRKADPVQVQIPRALELRFRGRE